MKHILGLYNINKYNLIILISIVVLFANYKTISADHSVVSKSAEIYTDKSSDSTDLRIIKLRQFLDSYDSPLSEYAEDFVYFSDLYNIDWRLVPAITGVESTFGKNIPFDSYNAYGWNNGIYKFDSWEESIEVINESLRNNYYDSGADNLKLIAKRYAPPSSTWEWKVSYFMNKIDPNPVVFDL